MDLSKLSKVKEGTAHVSDESAEDRVIKTVLGKDRIADSALPSTSKQRQEWLEANIKCICDSLGLNGSESSFIKERLTKMFNSFSVRTRQINDSLHNAQAQLKEYQSKLKKIEDSLEEAKAASKADKLVIQELSNTTRSLQIKVQDSNGKVKDVTAKMTKIADDNQYILQTKEEAERQAEEKKKQIEELQKQLDAEKARAKEATVTVGDSLDEDTAARFAETFETFIQTGSQLSANKLKKIAEEIGDEEITELVNRATEYEPLDETTYEDLTSPLKEELTKLGQSIPSLPLIKDSAKMKEIKDCAACPFEASALQAILQDIYDYVQFPVQDKKEEIESKLKELSKWTLAKSVAEEPTVEGIQNVVEEANAVVEEPIMLQSEPVITMPVPVQECEECPATVSVLSHDQYDTIYDSASKFKGILNILSKVHDNNIDCAEIQEIRKSPCGTMVEVIRNGISEYFIPKQGDASIDQIVAQLNAAMAQPHPVQNEMWWQLIPIDKVKEVAIASENLPLVTDSVLYKRRLTDESFVTDVFDSSSVEKIVKSLRPVIGAKCAASIYSKVKDSKSKARIACSSGKFPNPNDFRSMKVSDSLSFKSDDGKFEVRLYI